MRIRKQKYIRGIDRNISLRYKEGGITKQGGVNDIVLNVGLMNGGVQIRKKRTRLVIVHLIECNERCDQLVFANQSCMAIAALEMTEERSHRGRYFRFGLGIARSWPLGQTPNHLYFLIFVGVGIYS